MNVNEFVTIYSGGNYAAPIWDEYSSYVLELILNGDFTGGTTNWTLGAGVAYGSNNIAFTSSSSNTSNSTPSLDISKMYLVTFDISNYAAGSIHSNLGGTVSGSEHSSNGSKVDYIYTNSSNNIVYLTSTGFSGTIDNVSVTEVGGSVEGRDCTINNIARLIS